MQKQDQVKAGPSHSKYGPPSITVFTLKQALIEAYAAASAAKKAAAVRHRPLQEFKEKAATVARSEWENGSGRLHHEMAKYLAEEYQDHAGKYPFTNLPVKSKSSPEKVLCQVCKEVAKGMDRTELVFGLNKK